MKDKLRDKHEQPIERIIGNGIVEGEEMDITTNKILDYIEQNFEPKKPESGTQQDLLPKSGEQIKEIILQVMRGEIFTEQAEQQLLALIEKEKKKEELQQIKKFLKLIG